jgi:hypothetical protein
MKRPENGEKDLNFLPTTDDIENLSNSFTTIMTKAFRPLTSRIKERFSPVMEGFRMGADENIVLLSYTRKIIENPEEKLKRLDLINYLPKELKEKGFISKEKAIAQGYNIPQLKLNVATVIEANKIKEKQQPKVQYALPENIDDVYQYLQCHPNKNPKLLGKINAFYRTLPQGVEELGHLPFTPIEEDMKSLNRLAKRSKQLEARCESFTIPNTNRQKFDYRVSQEIIDTFLYLSKHPDEHPELLEELFSFYNNLPEEVQEFRYLPYHPIEEDMEKLVTMKDKTLDLKLKCVDFSIGINEIKPKEIGSTTMDGVKEFGYKL